MLEKLKTWLYRHRNNPVLSFLDALVKRILEFEVFPRAGQLSYFTTLSLFPFIIALLNILNYTSLVDPSFIRNLVSYLPKSTASVILTFADQIALNSSASLLSISLIMGLWSASSGVRQLIKIINGAYQLQENRNFFEMAFLGLAFTLGLIVMILLLLFSRIIGSELIQQLNNYFPLNQDLIGFLYRSLNIIGPIYALIFLVCLYGISPNLPMKKLGLKSLLPGSLFALVGILLGTVLFTYYVSNFGKYAMTYGYFAGMILLLLWIYLVNIVLQVGCQINALVYLKRQGGLTWPREDSVLKDLLPGETKPTD
ncbi:YihY/virulence factor BrkB family protein [Urinicoccus massiliensis]|uniref:YihY/virulence factor BrkB family protein n=1 Tax=Urinicoccus massiliensis TaxID=1723382 RepID=UPI0009310EEF|nr:YihY/virulence factor BrkB family protein [Urinicoccus massiliensis]